MGSLLRSEEMALCQLFLQSEAAYTCVSELGELGLLQFRDLNPDVSAFQRKFVNEVRRCDEMERKLRFLEKEVRKDGIPMLDTGDNPDAPAPREMIDLEATFEKLETEMKEVNRNSEALKRNYLELTELRHILKKTRTFFEEAEFDYTARQALNDPSLGEETIGLLGEDLARTSTGHALRLGFVAGVIIRERIPAFEIMLWRACRGNVFLRQTEIDTPLEDPVSGIQVSKSVFIIFFQGDQLKLRVKKICEGFRATLYPCPETHAERREMEMGVVTRIEDLNTVLAQTQEHRHRVLVAAAKNIKVWFVKVRKIKAIYHTLNMFNLDVTQKCLIAECWCPVADLDRIQQALRRGTERSGSSVPSILNRMGTRQVPPIYNRTNKFTSAFQALIDAYGVATYREVNPTPFTIITFPFLFAVMFGDFGHGFLMFLFALWMVVREKRLGSSKTDNEIWNTLFSGRYLVLLMGIFSVYTGFIYNDIFSKSVNVFGSHWTRNIDKVDKNVTWEGPLMFLPNITFVGSSYPIGIDPIWQLAENKITYTNSLKMKMSIILGLFHMYFGIMLSLCNYKYFKQRINIYCLFLPQVIFLFCIFGYLVILIFSKWLKFNQHSSAEAPSLLVGIINMFMFKVDKNKMYVGQKPMEHFLVIVCALCVPWMLLSKPLTMRRQHQRKRMTSANAHSLAEEGNEVTHHDTSSTKSDDFPPEEEFVMSEVMIESAIHTMEFCMNCVSHSASYLRLWALSLAHAQLSEVLWGMVMALAFRLDNYGGAIMMVFVFLFWACLTIFVLLIMEGLSAFLHALRLHWIEFQSKFYKGEGYIFKPFSFEEIMDTAPATDD